MAERTPVAIVGANGYTGGELMRILARHPHARVTAATSRSQRGTAITASFPQLHGHADLPAVFEDLDAAVVAGRARVVFACLPHGESQTWVRDLLAAGALVIDLSADFRYGDAASYARAYGEHAAPQLLAGAAYGLTEWNRGAVRAATLIANPGCYPTAVQLALLPLLAAGLVGGTVIADCQSGVTGAGRTARPGNLFSEVAEAMKAYGLPVHRHESEMVHNAARLTGRTPDLLFTPHLAPVNRGIYATIHVPLAAGATAATARDAIAARYPAEPFVQLLPPGELPASTAVRGSNHAQLQLVPRAHGTVTLLATIDNLTKGAAGQAVQNMNVRMGWAETAGLDIVGLLP